MLTNWVWRRGATLSRPGTMPPAPLLVRRRCGAMRRRAGNQQEGAGAMPEQDDGRIVETATEARQGERGPSMLALLTVSMLLAIIVLSIAWFIFFQA